MQVAPQILPCTSNHFVFLVQVFPDIIFLIMAAMVHITPDEINYCSQKQHKHTVQVGK